MSGKRSLSYQRCTFTQFIIESYANSLQSTLHNERKKVKRSQESEKVGMCYLATTKLFPTVSYTNRRLC